LDETVIRTQHVRRKSARDQQRKATGFTSIRIDMENAGANVVDEEVVVCQNQLVTPVFCHP
jgi:putative intracellular protease/amidase